MIKHLSYTALLACALVVALPSPATAQDRDRRPERAERAERSEKPDRERDTPYSNRSVRREREAVRIIREVERQSRPSHYQFRDRRRPEN